MWGMGQGASEERERPRPNPFGEGSATEHQLMGSRVITVSMLRRRPRRLASNKRDPGLIRNRFKTNYLWKKVRLIITLLHAICIVDSMSAKVFPCHRHFVLYLGVEFFIRPWKCCDIATKEKIWTYYWKRECLFLSHSTHYAIWT